MGEEADDGPMRKTTMGKNNQQTVNLFGGSDQNEGQKLSTSVSASPKIQVSPKQGIEVSSIPPSKAHL